MKTTNNAFAQKNCQLNVDNNDTICFGWGVGLPHGHQILFGVGFIPSVM